MLRAMDYSSARPPVDQVDVVFRYLYDGPKGLGPDEAKTIHDAGKAIAPNFEQNVDNALRGPTQAAHDGAYANTHALSLGIPDSVWLWYSCDTAATYDQVAPYYEALNHPGWLPPAFYGPMQVGLKLMSAGLVKGVWVANAASWSGFSSWNGLATAVHASGAHVLQHLDHPLVGVDPAAYDYDEILRPFPVWGPAIFPEVSMTTSFIPRRQKSTVTNQDAWVDFNAAQKTVVGYNGVDFPDTAGWTIQRFPNSVVLASLTVTIKGDPRLVEKPDGSGVEIVATGDGARFQLPYKAPLPDPYISGSADVKSIAAHLKIVPT